MGRKTRKPQVPEEFIRLVREEMAKQGLSLRELGERADLSPSFLSRILSGSRNLPSGAELLRIAKALGIEKPRVLFAEAGRAHPEMIPLLRAASRLSKKELEEFTRDVEALIRKRTRSRG